VLQQIDIDWIYQVTAGPAGYSLILLTIAVLGVREAVRAADLSRRRVGASGLALLMAGVSLAIVGIRLSEFAW
jgi:hypothetical protein